ncbi:unnamed protein product, partial [Onchocerca flexuosa]|uniref:Dentin sialophosphoprotein-like n=1 Tax=Onchocerca flexuosa TaxID=387005 RepID=A0A183HB41_9BILA
MEQFDICKLLSKVRLMIDICPSLQLLNRNIFVVLQGNEDSASIRLRAEIERLRKESGENSDDEMGDTKSSSGSSTVASSESGDSDSECNDGSRRSASMVSKNMHISDDSRSRSSDSGDDDDLQ